LEIFFIRHTRAIFDPIFALGRRGMRVEFSRRQKFRFFGPNQLEVIVSVWLSEAEKSCIATRHLERLVVIDRMPTIFKEFCDEWREIDNNIYLGKLLNCEHIEPVTSPSHAESFEQEILAALERASIHFNRDVIAPQNKMHQKVPERLLHSTNQL
jgi:hypothetical protein